MVIKCEICGKGPSPERGGITVYRANEKGKNGIWRCAQHPSKESFDRQNDPAIAAVDAALDSTKSDSGFIDISRLPVLPLAIALVAGYAIHFMAMHGIFASLSILSR